MSHLTKLNVVIDNKDALIAAVEELGYGYVEGSAATMKSGYGWNLNNADIILTKNGSKLPIGFILKDGVYEVKSDMYGTGISAQTFRQDLFREYNKSKVSKILENKGYTVQYETAKNGDLVIIGMDWSESA